MKVEILPDLSEGRFPCKELMRVEHLLRLEREITEQSRAEEKKSAPKRGNARAEIKQTDNRLMSYNRNL